MPLDGGHMDVSLDPDASPETVAALREIGQAAVNRMRSFWVVERGQPEGFTPPEYIADVSYFDGERWTSDIHAASKWDTEDDAQKWIDAYGIAGRPVSHGWMERADG